jgi:TfoX/Sxy family transcriptional regulator of competence genes
MPSPPELVDRFTAVTDLLIGSAPDASRRKMFGYPACFAGGHLFTSLHEDRWIVRLPEPELTELAELGGSAFEPMPGRPMRGYLALPASILADAAELDRWLDRALAHVRTLPPK